MLDQDSSFYLISLNFLMTCFLNNVWILLGEVSCKSLLGVEGLSSCPEFMFLVHVLCS